MSHPYHEHRQTKKEHSRVGHITKGYKSGGAVKHSDAAEDRKLIKSMVKKADLKADGEKSKHRMDRPKRKRADGGSVRPPVQVSPQALALAKANSIQPWYGAEAQSARSAAAKDFASTVKRAKGGRVKKGGGKTVVNVITGHPGASAPPPMAPPMGIAGPPPGGPPAMPPRPPMAPQGMAPPGAGMPPGAPPMRAKGGRVQTPTGTGMAADDGVGSNRGDAVFNASRKNGTHISHTDGKGDEAKDIDRGKVVTFATGGGVRSFRAYGGKVESPQGVAKSTRLPGGSGGGKARLTKERRAERDYHGPD